MNRSQKILTLVFLVLFAATLIWVPILYSGETYFVEFHHGALFLDFDDSRIFRIEWMSLAAFYLALFFVFKSPKR
jgi:hypothetical protein